MLHTNKGMKGLGAVDVLASAIAQFEGFFNASSTLAQRNNNPGNLRSGVGQSGTDPNGLAIFPTVDAGWNALYNQISLDSSRGLTVEQFMAKYAPPTENDTSAYTNFVVGKLGVPSDTPLTALYSGSPSPSPSPSSSGTTLALDIPPADSSGPTEAGFLSGSSLSPATAIFSLAVGLLAFWVYKS